MTTSSFLVVHEISDDYHPIAGPPGEMFEKFCSTSYSLYFDDYDPIAGPPRDCSIIR